MLLRVAMMGMVKEMEDGLMDGCDGWFDRWEEEEGGVQGRAGAGRAGFERGRNSFVLVQRKPVGPLPS